MVGTADRPVHEQRYILVPYASSDRDPVMPLVEALWRVGGSVWLDQQVIAGGEDYSCENPDTIEGCVAFALMAASAPFASRTVAQEIALGW